MQTQRTKRILNADLFKKGKMVPCERTTNSKLERIRQSKSNKMIAECERLTAALDAKLNIPNPKLRRLQLERLAKRISDWEKKADGYVSFEMQGLRKMDPGSLAYKRIHLLINKFTILHTLLQMAEKSGDLTEGYSRRALSVGVKKLKL
jgi:23S rRNA pseudoU1915 N3-methylase RlmH